MRVVRIHYRRLPDRDRVFEQVLLEETPEYSVTLLRSAPVERAVQAGGRTVLEPGAPVVWFTYPDRWYDVGRFHLADGTFTGLYANVLTPVRMRGDEWETTDLCLDVWRGAAGGVEVLDREELEEAVANGWMDGRTAATAREQADSLVRAAHEGTWPPPHVEEWTLERSLRRLRELGTDS